jgi:hypothetical protein
MTKALEKWQHTALISDLAPADAAHLEACAMTGSWEWLVALGATVPTQMPGYAIRLALRLRLRLPVIGLVRTDCHGSCPRPGCHGGVLDPGGRHAFTCKAGGLCIRFHDAVTRLICDWATDAGLSAHLATLADTDPPPGAAKTKVDLFVGAGPLVGDFPTTVLDMSAKTLVTRLDLPGALGSITSMLELMRRRQRAKIGKHGLGARRMGRAFVPFIFHTGGGLAPKALAFTKKLSNAATARLPPEPARRFHLDWMMRYSCTVQRMAADTLRHSQHYFTADGGLVHSSRHGAYVHQCANRLVDPAALICRCGSADVCYCNRDRRPAADFAPPRPRPPVPPAPAAS